MEAKDITTPETVNPTSDIASQPANQQPNMQIPEVLNQNQALQVLVDAARVAQTKGIFTLDDVSSRLLLPLLAAATAAGRGCFGAAVEDTVLDEMAEEDELVDDEYDPQVKI